MVSVRPIDNLSRFLFLRALPLPGVHLLLNCKLYKSERRQLKKDLGKFPLTTAMVLHTSIGLKALITFLTTTKIATRHGRTDEQGSRSGTGWGRLEE